MSRMNIGGRLPRQGLYRGDPSPLPPADDEGSGPSATDSPLDPPVQDKRETIPKGMAEQLVQEHQQGQSIEMLALRWGLTEEEITKAIARLGGLRK